MSSFAPTYNRQFASQRKSRRNIFSLSRTLSSFSIIILNRGSKVSQHARAYTARNGTHITCSPGHSCQQEECDRRRSPCYIELWQLLKLSPLHSELVSSTAPTKSSGQFADSLLLTLEGTQTVWPKSGRIGSLSTSYTKMSVAPVCHWKGRQGMKRVDNSSQGSQSAHSAAAVQHVL
jgi:hypothetical protein